MEANPLPPDPERTDPRKAGTHGNDAVRADAQDGGPAAPRPLGRAVARLGDAAAHTSRYAFKGVSRLARDAGLSPSSVSRVLAGKQSPSFLLVARLTGALEWAVGRRIDPRELVAEDGAFPTRHVCALMGCAGCLPGNALDEFGDTKPAFHGVRPGEWVASRHPRGYGKDEREKAAPRTVPRPAPRPRGGAAGKEAA